MSGKFGYESLHAKTLHTTKQTFWWRFWNCLLLEKAMETHSSTLAWKIPWVEEPGGLQSMGLLGVGHD